MREKNGVCAAALVCGLFLLPVTVQANDFLGWQFTAGGEERARYEYKDNFDYKTGKQTDNSHLYNRLRLNAKATLTDEYLDPKLDVFIEGLDAQVLGYQTAAALGQEDNLDLHQAYVSAYNVLSTPVDVRLGRMELKYGAERLIAAPPRANRIRAFDGGTVHLHQGGLWGDVIYGQDVKYDDRNLNHSTGNEYLTGFYGGYQEHKMAPLVEMYLLKMRDTSKTNDIERYTVGVRLQKNFGDGLVAEVELPFQFGDTGTTASQKTIRAYAFHADVKKTWEDVTWKPRLSVAYDIASGDRNKNDGASNTFVPLYQGVYEPYGLLDLVRWQNIHNLETSVTYSPTKNFKFTPQVDMLWLDSRNDAWYNSSGGTVRANAAGAPASYIGTELSLRGYYSLNDNIKLETGYAHFVPGEYTCKSGPHDSVDWFYTQVAIKF
jgi:hypothetical protein